MSATRFAKLSEAVNCNLDFDEKQGLLIDNWTPNNLKRLTIGEDFALLEYHVLVKGTKFSTKKSNLVPIPVDVAGTESKKSILRVLTDGRVCSSIEEIIFVSKKGLRSLDTDINGVCDNSTVATRFSRLTKVYSLACTQEQYMALRKKVAPTIKKCGTLYSALVEMEAPLTVFYSFEGNWWRGHLLRPRFYTLDEDSGVLAKHFKEVEDYWMADMRQTKLDQLGGELLEVALSKQGFLELIQSQTRMLAEILKLEKKQGIQDHILWANKIDSKRLLKNIHVYLEGKEINVSSLTVNESVRLLEGKGNTVAMKFLPFYTSLTKTKGAKSPASATAKVQGLKDFEQLLDSLIDAQVFCLWLCLFSYLNAIKGEETRGIQTAKILSGLGGARVNDLYYTPYMATLLISEVVQADIDGKTTGGYESIRRDLGISSLAGGTADKAKREMTFDLLYSILDTI